ncbi:hypothetical protein C5167_044865 [Papaver somniferum]|nr:hypothetical protein C5167_044865 [Papaver somniferum]
MMALELLGERGCSMFLPNMLLEWISTTWDVFAGKTGRCTLGSSSGSQHCSA